MTVKEFADKNRIEIKSIKVERNPNMEANEKWQMDNYEVTLSRWSLTGANRIEAKLTTYFSKGIGHKGKRPNVEEVLDCLISDSDALEYTFEDWCLNLGYEEDSIKALKTYEVCYAQAKALIIFLGKERFNELKNCERL